MKKIVSGSDAIIKLELKDKNGNIIPLYSEEVVKEIEIKVYTKSTAESDYIVITDLTKLENNRIKLNNEDLDKLAREQIYLQVYIKFYCDEFEDKSFDYKNKIATNIILTT